MALAPRRNHFSEQYIKEQISLAGLKDFQIEKIEDEYVVTYEQTLGLGVSENIKTNLANSFPVKIMINFSPIRLEGKEEGEDLEFPNLEDIEPLLKSANINYQELNNMGFGAWELILENFGYSDESLAENIMLSLSETEYNLVNLQPQGELNNFIVSGGIQSAKRLIGSTAQLDFRVRECGKNKPEDLDINVWELVKCYDPQYYNQWL